MKTCDYVLKVYIHNAGKKNVYQSDVLAYTLRTVLKSHGHTNVGVFFIPFGT